MMLRIREETFQAQVIELAAALGWRIAHFRGVRVQRHDGSSYYQTPVQAHGAGFPDLVLVRERVLFRELKSDTGRLRRDQETWIERLQAAGADAGVWRPRDWDALVAELEARR